MTVVEGFEPMFEEDNQQEQVPERLECGMGSSRFSTQKSFAMFLVEVGAGPSSTMFSTFSSTSIAITLIG